jgi:hypothetical protein
MALRVGDIVEVTDGDAVNTGKVVAIQPYKNITNKTDVAVGFDDGIYVYSPEELKVTNPIKVSGPVQRMPKARPGEYSKQVRENGFGVGDSVLTAKGELCLVLRVARDRAFIFMPDGKKRATPKAELTKSEAEFDPKGIATAGCVVTLKPESAARHKMSTKRLFVIIGEASKGRAWQLVPVNQGLDVPYTYLSINKGNVSAPLRMKDEK